MNYPLIEVLIPAYNIKDYIEKAVVSVVNQSYPNVRVIVGDDESNDGTLDVLDQLSLKYSNVSVLKLTHRGLIGVRKALVEASTADYIMHLDGDDYLTLDCIEVLFKKLVDDDLDISVGNFYRESPSYTFEVKANQQKIFEGEDYLKKLLTNDISNSVWGKIYKRTLFEGIEYPLDISLSEDRIINSHVAMKEPRVGHIDKAVCYYVKRTDSIVHNRSIPDGYMERIINLLEKYLLPKPHLKPLLIVSIVNYYIVCINSSKSPDITKQAWVVDIYDRLKDPQTNKLYKSKISFANRLHVKLCRRNATKPLAYFIMIFRRLGMSIQKRIVKNTKF